MRTELSLRQGHDHRRGGRINHPVDLDLGPGGLHELPYREAALSKIDFVNEQVQRATWSEIRDVILNAMVEAVARARAAVPTEDPREMAVRDGMILDQMHVILCEVLGETE